jgi:hypothetical protein
MSKTKSAPANRYKILLLGTEYEVGLKVFNRLEFLEPGARYQVSTREKPKHMTRFPLTSADIGPLASQQAFDESLKAFDNSQLRFELPGSQEIISTTELYSRAHQETPDPEGSHYRSYDLYSKRHFRVSYARLLDSHKASLVERFKAAFEENTPADASSGLCPKQEAFSHTPVVATSQALEVYQGLAAQGHVYSQYLAGLLLATETGGYSASCVCYLLDAHEHKHPEALKVLAEFLLGCEDYQGAMQCALLSLAGGHKMSAKVIHGAMHSAYEDLLSEQGSILKAVQNSGMSKLMSTHFPELRC